MLILVMLGQILAYKEGHILVEPCCETQLSQELKALLRSFFPPLVCPTALKESLGAWKLLGPPTADHQRSSLSPQQDRSPGYLVVHPTS